MRVLVSAAAGPIIVSVIRLLKNSGHTVIGMDVKENAIGRFYCDEFYVSPWASDAAAFIGFLNRLAPQIDVFFSYVDEEIETLAKARQKNELGAIDEKWFASEPETLLTCTNKERFQNWAEQAGLPIAPRATAAPAIAKPLAGRGAKGIVYIDDAELFAYFEKKENYICQQIIKGTEYTIDTLIDLQGNYVFGVARKRIDARGVSITGEIDMNTDVLQFCRELVTRLPFRGPINIQVMREESTGKLFLIEVNPRLSGSLVFSAHAGFDIASAAVDVFCGGNYQPPKPEEIADGRCFYRFWEDIDESRRTMQPPARL